MNGQPANRPIRELDLAGVDSGSDFETERLDCFADSEGASNCTCGSIERGEEAVAGSIDFLATESLELSPYGRVVKPK